MTMTDRGLVLPVPLFVLNHSASATATATATVVTVLGHCVPRWFLRSCNCWGGLIEMKERLVSGCIFSSSFRFRSSMVEAPARRSEKDIRTSLKHIYRELQRGLRKEECTPNRNDMREFLECSRNDSETICVVSICSEGARCPVTVRRSSKASFSPGEILARLLSVDGTGEHQHLRGSCCGDLASRNY
jgi:hypothetical protein